MDKNLNIPWVEKYRPKNIEKIVVKIGAANDMLTTVANGNSLNPIKIATNATKPDAHLKKCNPALFVT